MTHALVGSDLFLELICSYEPELTFEAYIEGPEPLTEPKIMILMVLEHRQRNAHGISRYLCRSGDKYLHISYPDMINSTCDCLNGPILDLK
jgi:hypothetical protein